MRKIAFVILLLAAVGSLLSVLNSGSHAPALLIVLFAGWVLSPYIALFIVNSVSTLRSAIPGNLLYKMMLLISLGSLAVYGVTLIQHRIKPATAVYLGVPLLSWIIIGTVVSITTYKKRKPLIK